MRKASAEGSYGKVPEDEKRRKKWHDKVRSGLRELRKRVTFADGGLLTDNPNAIQHSPRAKGTPYRRHRHDAEIERADRVDGRIDGRNRTTGTKGRVMSGQRPEAFTLSRICTRSGIHLALVGLNGKRREYS